MRSEQAPSIHTHFFRDEPQLLAVVQALASASTDVPARLWSAGCSTGAEPYSLAMLCAERGVPVEIVATDFADEALAIARAARYNEHALRHVSPARRTRFFTAEQDRFALSRAIRDTVTFTRGDLCDPPSTDVVRASFQVVVCRNVLIYYDADEAARLLRSLAQRLAPGGALFLGASDHFTFRAADVPLCQKEIAGVTAYAAGSESVPRVRDDPPRIHVPASVPPAPAMPRTNGTSSAAEITTRVHHAFAQIAQHAFDEAAGVLEEAVHLDPTAPEPYYYLGLLRRKQGRHRDAVDALRRAHLLAPEFWPASFLLAGAWERLGRPDQAAQARARVVSQLQRGAGVGAFRVAAGDPLFDVRAVLAACEPSR